jgi:peptidoglycan hydrolase CwlO-like protein
MKLIVSVLAIIAGIIIGFQASAQVPVEISKKVVTMSKGEQPAFIVEIPQVTAENVEKSWMKLIRQNTKSKVSTENSEITILNTQIDEISDNPINIYSAVYQVDSAVKLVSLFEIDSSFFSFDGDKEDMNYERTYEGIEHFLHEFAVTEYKEAAEEELKAEDKELKNLNNELQKLVKQTESFQKKIKLNESDSLNAEDQISSLEIDKQRKQGEIDGKKESMSTISGDKELHDQAKKHLKSLEKQRKKIEKEIEKLMANIVEYHSDNVELKRGILENNKKKEELLDEISIQQETVIKVTGKLENIK